MLHQRAATACMTCLFLFHAIVVNNCRRRWTQCMQNTSRNKQFVRSSTTACTCSHVGPHCPTYEWS